MAIDKDGGVFSFRKMLLYNSIRWEMSSSFSACKKYSANTPNESQDFFGLRFLMAFFASSVVMVNSSSLFGGNALGDWVAISLRLFSRVFR